MILYGSHSIKHVLAVGKLFLHIFLSALCVSVFWCVCSINVCVVCIQV